ncbi:hypothetical protein [Pseudoduganella sp. GCM10020061]|jgi:hypothetical protein|uniref:hypothetical protein n=1 Tax=Pseudoduganella sp. GCM10020061 TaxID=3317345 RepID=UPI00362E0EB5
MRNFRYPFGRDVGAQAQQYMQVRDKRRRVREILARREEWRLLVLMVAILVAVASAAVLLARHAYV